MNEEIFSALDSVTSHSQYMTYYTISMVKNWIPELVFETCNKFTTNVLLICSFPVLYHDRNESSTF